MEHPETVLGRLARAALLVCVAGAIVTGIAACEERTPAPTAAAAGDRHVYTVRGRIAALPEPGKPASQLMIHHETIPGFVGKDGRVVGMQEMTMPFVPAKDVSLDGLKRGDGVEFTFEVQWSPRPSSTLTKIAKLPEGTSPDLKAGN